MYRGFFYFIFALSGFSGLVYESVWSHYLKLLLGHAAYAQALVLIIFMGGMALGAWLASRNSHRLGNLLIAYAVVEGVIGVMGVVFHPVYQSVSTASFEYVIPLLNAPFYVDVYKVLAASLLILPQSILLGATFPLMSGGFIRKFPAAPGRSISMLYFTNSLGAALALLVSSFYLIGKLGLPGTMLTAGLINIGVALIVYALVRAPSPPAAPRAAVAGVVINRSSWILAAAFLTGLASFIYEVAWIRMLSMVLGSSTHAFELMLCAFITGLAIGGYLIRKKIDSLEEPVAFAAIVQMMMGFFALSTVLLYGYSYGFMSFIMSALNKTEEGYVLFGLANYGIALLIMLPATICAGMTLPLFTYILLKRGHGERSIGQVYASNTIGAICGVLFTVFVGMPILGLKGSILTGAVIDFIIGAALVMSLPLPRPRYPAYLAALFITLVSFSVFFYELDTRRMASGIFRHGLAELDNGTTVLFHKDGRTASVSVTDWDNKKISIMTNGKPDASITVAENLPPAIDESTMILLAALPVSIHPGARKIANIGMGSGLTAHVALGWPGIERVDTIEIEEAMVEGARFFGSKTGKVFTDPRSRVHLADARTYFSTHKAKYDVIISEPSNPWVSGVSSLFTHQFYEMVRRHLNTGGLLVQWIHLYEFDLELLVSILKAISLEFPYYSLYFADDGNLIVLAGVDKPVDAPDQAIFESMDMKAHLSTVHIHNIEDIRFRFIGDQSLYDPFIRRFTTPANSDYHPFLDLNAEKSRFLGKKVSDILNVRISAVPILDLLYDGQGPRMHNLSPTKFFPAEDAEAAYRVYEYFTGRVFNKDNIITIASLNFLFSAGKSCAEGYNHEVWADSIFLVFSRTISYLTTSQINQMIDAVTPECGLTALPANLANWISLFKAMNESDIPGLVEASGGLLRADDNLDPDQKKFLLTTLLTGLIKAGEYGQAQGLWKNHMMDLFVAGGDVPLEIQLLLAKAKDHVPSESRLVN